MHQVDSSLLTVKIHDLARGGAGVAKLESGEVVFVPFTSPGDEALIRITEKNKNYSKGELVELVRPSDFRVTPPCAVFGRCGGCSWQHLPYDLQFQTKKKGVFQALKRAGLPVAGDQIAGVSCTDFPAAQHYGYRNRIQLKGDAAERILGFYFKGSKEIVDIARCEISDEAINGILPTLKETAFAQFEDEFKVEIDVSPEGEVRHAYNQPNAAFGFRQVNDAQNLVLQKWVSEQAGEGELLIDLFGGFGNLSVPIADRFQSVQCVDISVPAQKPTTLPNHFRFHRSDVLMWLKKQKANRLMKATIILDPPREGLGGNFAPIEALLSDLYNIERLILVGCEADSFARDTAAFIKKGFTLKKLGVLDLFPQTPHVESLALFSK